jgi:hypothetical protein
MPDLAKLVNLNTLIGRGCDFTDECISYLSCLERLEVLDLHRCGKLTDKALETILTFKNLQELHLWECKNISIEALRTLKGMPHLELIRMAGCGLSEDLWLNLKKAELH